MSNASRPMMCVVCTVLGLSAPQVYGQPQNNAKLQLTRDAVDESAGGLAAFRIDSPSATYYLEKSGGGLSSLIDRDGNDWLSFHPQKNSGAAGEYRGFPNAVHKQSGSYFHPKNSATDPSTLRVEYESDDRITITAESDNGLWAGRYDFFATHATFTMTRMPADRRYWILYEGTPGGGYDDDDWWITSAQRSPQPMTRNHEGDIPDPEWIAFGDRVAPRVLLLLHHSDDSHPDYFYQMQHKMTVFGFGRRGIDKFLDSVPQQFSLSFVESRDDTAIERHANELLRLSATNQLMGSDPP